MPKENEIINHIFPGETGTTAPEAEETNPVNPETPETDTSNGDEQQEHPRLFAGKYKTVEEMEQAYIEAQRSFHLDRQEKAELRRQLEEIKQAIHPKSEPDMEKYREKLIERLYNEPDTVITELADQIADRKVRQALGPVMPAIQQQIMNSKVQHFMTNTPDAAEYANDMAVLVQANPDIVKKEDWIERAYYQAKLARMEAKLSGKENRERKERVTASKQAAQMPDGGKGDPAPEKTKEEKVLENIFTPSHGGGIFD